MNDKNVSFADTEEGGDENNQDAGNTNRGRD
jgi:hypothetical protein